MIPKKRVVDDYRFVPPAPRFAAAANGWTGGQYSLFRLIFGGYLFIHFVQLWPWAAELFSNQGALPNGMASPILYAFPNMFSLCDSPSFVTGVVALAACLSVAFAIGFRDRWAALGLWYIWACLFGRNPLILNPGLPYVGLLLFVHVFLPRAPYGSFDRRSNPDPNSEWRMPQQFFIVVWALMALGYTYSGYTKLVSTSWVDGNAFHYVLTNPLARPSFVRDFMLALPPWCLNLATWGALAAELTFLPLALFKRLRPSIWTSMLLMHLGLIVLINFADLSLGMVMLHLFTFDPAWIRRKTSSYPDHVFYDGGCGLCHGAVRFLLAEDSAGDAFRFSAMESDFFVAAIDAERRAQLPDSMVVLTGDGDILVRSAAWLRILDRLGGVWRVIGTASRVVPQGVRDAVYDVVAASRKKLFKRPEAACPILPPALRSRFKY